MKIPQFSRLHSQATRRNVLTIGLAIIALPCFAAAPASQSNPYIRQERQVLRISQASDPAVESKIAEDGSMVNLCFLKPSEIYNLMPNPHRPDFLKKGIGLPTENALGGSRGIFFWQNEAVPLPNIEIVAPDSVHASGQKASLNYQFAPDGVITLTAQNKTDAPMQFLMVLDSTVCAVQAPDSDLEKTPVVKLWTETIWYQDYGSDNRYWKVNIKGGDRIWGPAQEVATPWREGLYQVWEASLAPQETRTITISASSVTPEEAAEVKALVPDKIPARKSAEIAFPLAPQANDSALAVYSPKDYQVFQRSSESEGTIRVSGSYTEAFDKVEVRLTGDSSFGKVPTSWQTASHNTAAHGFNTDLVAPAGGWYQLDIRISLNGTIVTAQTIDHVGLGEVFVTCGQSNSTNYGATEDVRNKTQTGLVSSFGGGSWQLCEDPLPGSSDGSMGGSPWTFFGDALVRKYQVPVAIAITGHGGAPVQFWTPGSFPFLWVMTRINQFGPQGFRAMLWHQGESSVRSTSEFYYNTLKEIIESSRQVAGWDIPWFVAQVSYHNPKESSFQTTRTAQKQLWDDGIAMEGPDTDTLVGESRAGIHLSTLGLQQHGEMWADYVGKYMDGLFEQEHNNAKIPEAQ